MKDDGVYLQHILRCISRIDEYTATGRETFFSSHLIHVSPRQEAAAQQDRDLVGVELVVLGVPAVDGLHCERVAEHKRDAFGGADIREPVPGSVYCLQCEMLERFARQSLSQEE